MSTGVYQIKCRVNNRKYVGSGSSKAGVAGRLGKHKNALRRNAHFCTDLQEDWNRYGEDAFEFSVLEECPPENCAERERSYLPDVKTAEELKEAGFYNRSTTCFSFSQERRANMSAIRKGKKLSDETKAKISAANKGREGRKPSAEGIARISAALSKRKISEETRAKLSAAKIGRETSAETRAKLSAAQRGKKASEETRAKLSAAKKGKKLTEEHRARISAGFRKA